MKWKRDPRDSKNRPKGRERTHPGWDRDWALRGRARRAFREGGSPPRRVDKVVERTEINEAHDLVHA